MLNNSYDELVKKYEKYKNKKTTFFLLKVVLGLLLVGVILYYFMQEPKQAETNKQINNPITESKKPIEKEVQKSVEKKDETKNKQVTKEKNENKIQPKKEYKPVNKVVTSKEKSVDQNPIKLEVTQRKELVRLLKEYEIKKDFASSMNLSLYYLESDRFQQSIKWAIKSSKLDPSSSEPWILYAKAKHKQGKTKVAIKALNIYLKRYKSKEAQNLLDTLKNATKQ